ncbi:MAG: hypothetical protein E7557_02830 [Ruminococcaceae bacterium]|nr:hypothetical protein [Oscillospiraceae bacterium]
MRERNTQGLSECRMQSAECRISERFALIIIEKRTMMIPFVVFVLAVIVFVVKFEIFSNTYIPEYQEEINLIGKNECIVYYTNDGFQDYTDYAIYTFNSPNIENNQNFKMLGEQQGELEEYLDNFENWVKISSEESEIYKNYDFDKTIIDENDYIYISDKSEKESMYSKFDSYNVYIFDSQTKTLYYFHNNI